MKSLFTCFSLLLAVSFIGCSQDKVSVQSFPSYEEIVRHYYSNYDHVNKTRGVKLVFEKRPEGYFVCLINYPGQIREQREMLWSYQSKSFQTLENYSSQKRKLSSNDVEALTDKYEKHIHDFSPFAGYPEWPQDVVKYFGKTESLSDSLLYGLARAYSTWSSNLLNDHSAPSKSSKPFDLPKTKNSLSTAQLKEYLKYAKLAIENYHKLHQQNPNFETRIGKSYIKYSGEIMHHFLLLQYFQNEEEARKLLRPGLFNKFLIQTAKNFLASCPPNAILITYGDNDTYPLLYVQAMENYRTDVLVANVSLLVLDRYINHLRDGVFEAEPLPMTLPKSTYLDDKNVSIIVQPNSSKYIKLEDAISEIISEEKKYEWGENKYAVMLSSHNLFMEIDKEKVKHIIPHAMKNEIVDSVKWQLRNKRNLLRDKLITLDIIHANKWKRPICVVISGTIKNFVGLEDYFFLEGLVYRMLPVKGQGRQNYLDGDINVEDSYLKITKDFLWGSTEKIDTGTKTLYINYFLLFYNTAKGYMQQGLNEKSIEIIDFFIKEFPNSRRAYSSLHIDLVDLCFQLGEKEKAETIAVQILDNFEQNVDSEIRKTRGIKRLEEIAIKYNSPAVQKKVDQL